MELHSTALTVKYTELCVKRLEASEAFHAPMVYSPLYQSNSRATGKALQLECVEDKHSLKLHASSVRGTKDANDNIAARVNGRAAGEPQWCLRLQNTGIRTQCDEIMKENQSTLKARFGLNRASC